MLLPVVKLMATTGAARHSLSAIVASHCTPQAITPVDSSSAQARALGGARQWCGSAAQSAAAPAVETAAITNTIAATDSLLFSERTHSLAADRKAACGGRQGPADQEAH